MLLLRLLALASCWIFSHAAFYVWTSANDPAGNDNRWTVTNQSLGTEAESGMSYQNEFANTNPLSPANAGALEVDTWKLIAEPKTQSSTAYPLCQKAMEPNGCSGDFLALGGFCFHFSSSPKTFAQTESYCASLSASLAYDIDVTVLAAIAPLLTDLKNAVNKFYCNPCSEGDTLKFCFNTQTGAYTMEPIGFPCVPIRTFCFDESGLFFNATGTCYKHYVGAAKSWDDAYADCEGRAALKNGVRGRLAIIPNAAIHLAINGKDAWVGSQLKTGGDITNRNDWEWYDNVNGTYNIPGVLNYTQSNLVQLSTSAASPCLYYDTKSAFKSDVCSALLAYVCEFQGVTQSECTSPSGDTVVWIAEQNTCFVLYKSVKQSWTNAFGACTSIGTTEFPTATIGRLAIVPNADVHNRLDFTDAWIAGRLISGGNYLTQSDWEWVEESGGSYSVTGALDYIGGTLVSLSASSGKPCLYYDTTTAYHSDVCSATMDYICEYLPERMMTTTTTTTTSTTTTTTTSSTTTPSPTSTTPTTTSITTTGTVGSSTNSCVRFAKSDGLKLAASFVSQGGPTTTYDCGQACTLAPPCASFSVHQLNGECVLDTAGNPTTTDPDPAWVTYRTV